MDPEDVETEWTPNGIIPVGGGAPAETEWTPEGIVETAPAPAEPRPRDLEGDATGSLNRYVGKTAQNNKRVTDDVMPTLSERTPMTQLADFDVRPEAPPRARDAVEIPQVVRDVANGLIGGFDRLSGASRRQNAMARITGHSPNSGPVEVPDSYSPGALATGGAQALTLGHADELGGAAASLVRGTPYRQEQEAAEARDARIQQEAPGSYAVGTVAGTAPWMLLPGLGEWAGEQAAARGAGGFVQGAARLAGSTAEGAAFGGAAAEGASTADAGSGEWAGDVAGGAAGGALLSGGAQVLAEAPGIARRVAEEVGSGARNRAAMLRVRATGARTPSIENVERTFPRGVEGMSEVLHREGLTGTFDRVQDIVPRAAEVRRRAGRELEEILAQASAPAASGGAHRGAEPGLVDIDAMARRIHSEVVSPLEGRYAREPRAVADEMSELLDNFQGDRRPLTAARIQDLQEQIDELIPYDNANALDKLRAGAWRDARRIVREELDSALDAAGRRINDPALLERYSRARSAYAASTRIAGPRGWGPRELARDASYRQISPTDYFSAGTATVAGGPVMGAATLVANRIFRDREKSMMATGLEALSRALSRPRGAPMLSPALRNTLANAARRGSAVYAAAVFSALHTGTPEERAAIQAGLDGTEPEPTQETP